MIILVIGLVALGCVSGAYWLSRRGTSTTEAGKPLTGNVGQTTIQQAPNAAVTSAAGGLSSGTPTGSASPSTLPNASSTISTQRPAAPAVAYATLMDAVSRDEAAVNQRLDGRLVVTLAAKTAGTVDPLETTQSGSHRFGWEDILREYQGFKNDSRFGSKVLIFPSNLVGSGVTDPQSGRPYLITFADVGFSDSKAVASWCEQMFPSLSQTQRNDTCIPMQMNRHQQ